MRNGNGIAPSAPVAGVPIVGQPFTLHSVMCPVTATLSCNCGGPDTAVNIVASVAAECPSCHRVYNFAFNPTKNQLEVQMAVPTAEQGKPS